MARSHARIRLDMWADDDYRDLSHHAQWLYEFLLSSPALAFTGVHPWRPGVIGGHCATLNADAVEVVAEELEVGLFIIVDRDTEECLVRSFIKHDGLMQSPNMVKALSKAHAEIGSAALRGVIVHELRRLRRKSPDLKGWEHAADLLRKRSLSPSAAIASLPRNPSVNPSGNPSPKGSGTGSGKASPTPVLLSSLTPNSLSSSSPFVTRGAANG